MKKCYVTIHVWLHDMDHNIDLNYRRKIHPVLKWDMVCFCNIRFLKKFDVTVVSLKKVGQNLKINQLSSRYFYSTQETDENEIKTDRYFYACMISFTINSIKYL